MDEPVPYAVLIDRISHEVPYYRLVPQERGAPGRDGHQQPVHVDGRRQVLRRVAGDEARRRPPKTVVLPNKDYVPGIVPRPRACATSIYPLDWQAIVDYVGLPCVLKDAHGGGWKQRVRLPLARGADPRTTTSPAC